MKIYILNILRKLLKQIDFTYFLFCLLKFIFFELTFSSLFPYMRCDCAVIKIVPNHQTYFIIFFWIEFIPTSDARVRIWAWDQCEFRSPLI